jgi:hypothetical protein
MKVIHARIENVLGLSLLEVEPGQVTIFEGKNGYGKTSSVDAIQSVFFKQGLKLIKNIHADDDAHARIVLTFQDDEGRQVIAERNEKGVKVQRQILDPKLGLTAGFEKIKRPAEYLAELLPDGSIVNPVKILTTNDKDRIDMLLNALPIVFDEDDFWNTIGLRKEDFRNAPTHKHPLFQISHYYKEIFDRRTDINRDEKSKRSACYEMRKKVPMVIPTVDGFEEKQNELGDLKARHAEGREQINGAARADENSITAQCESECRLLDSELSTFREQVMREAEQRVAARKAEIDKQQAQERNDAQERIGAVHAARDMSLENIDRLLPKIEAVSTQLGQLKEQLQNAERIQHSHEIAETYEREADSLKSDSDRYTQALGEVDKYKANLTKNLPISGVDITDGKLTIDGVPWKTVNMGRRIEIAVAIICLRFGNAKFKPVFVDGIESLDSEALGLLNQELIKVGAQAFMARVTDAEGIVIRKVG